MSAAAIDILPAHAPERLARVRALFLEYAAGLGIDLGFQDFEGELESLPGEYAPPRGGLWLAEAQGGDAGCAALRPLGGEAAELKRMYVRPAWRGRGLGRCLAGTIIASARAAGYRALRLDTLSSMAEARALYRSLGFRPIPAYCPNPLPGTEWMELELDRQDGPK
ncbi:MAG TPA: GNAT family N-acetyltransferase [Candidatus Desulfobacillus sp.]|nr:GNAT family N-acetyltransferase [Candidatus Desulfobacillus sp.]